MKKNAIVILGGGSAKGLAHIGALEIIEKDFNIKGIIGTSMGAIIGGLYSLGKSPQEIKKIFKEFSLFDYLSMISIPFTNNGFINAKKFEEKIFEHIGNVLIEDSKIPFIAISFNLTQHKTVLINKGKLAYAMRSSSSLPIIFAPFKSEGNLYIDGGIEYPLAVPFKNIFGDFFSIAVNVLPAVPLVPELHTMNFEDKDKLFKENNIKHSLTSVIDNQAFLASKSASIYKPDILINAHLKNLNSWEFMKVDEFYNKGKESAQLAIDKFKEDDKSLAKKLNEKYEQLKDKISKIKYV